MTRSLHARLLAAVLATATLAGACGALDSDGDAIPDQIGDGDRAAISEVLSGWLEALNRSDLTTAQLYALTPGEIGFPTFERLIVEMAANTVEFLEYEFQGLDAVTAAGDYVVVTFETNFGRREAEMVLRDGLWKLSRFPRMLLPSAEGPLNITHRVLREVQRSSLERIWLVEFTNESDVPALWNSAWALVFDQDGNENAAGSSLLTTRPFLWPGESTLVRIDGRLRVGVGETPAEIVPVFRRAFDSDRAVVVDVEATDVELTREGLAQRVVVTGSIANPDLFPIAAGAVALVYDDGGALLALASVRDNVQVPPGGSAELSVVVPFGLDAEEATRAELAVLATTLRSQ